MHYRTLRAKLVRPVVSSMSAGASVHVRVLPPAPARSYRCWSKTAYVGTSEKGRSNPI